MAPVTQRPTDERGLEEKLAELAAEEKRLKNRIDNSQILTAVAAIVALVVSIAALAVALTNSPGTTYVTGMSGSSRTSSASGGGSSGAMGAGGMMGARGAATSRTVDVGLGEMFVRPSATSISAGKVTFAARNTGQLPHELMIERMPIKMDAPGKPTESAALGMIDDMSPGQSGKMTVKLTPGAYMLFCNVPGHYAAGQHTTFTVTR